MPVTITFTSDAGTFNFHDYCLPLISRSVEYVRKNPLQPTDRKRVNVILNGFFTGNTHDEVVAQYVALKNVLDVGNRVTWDYNDGATSIASGPVRIRTLSEPEDWKQYDGSYTINFDYIERADLPASGSMPAELQASFTNSAGTITLHPCPTWNRQIKPQKGSTADWTKTPSGADIGAEATITLQGSLTDAAIDTDGPSIGDPTTNLYDIQQNFIDILTNPTTLRTGTLNYGSFSEEVYIDSVTFGDGVLEDAFDYTIVAKYFTEEVMKMTTQIVYGRIHSHPKITERPFCGDRRIRFGNTSGQEVTYSLKLWAESIASAQSLLATEVATVVTPGGIEMPGGQEIWDYPNRAVAVTIKKFYDTPILSNL